MINPAVLKLFDKDALIDKIREEINKSPDNAQSGLAFVQNKSCRKLKVFNGDEWEEIHD